MNAFLYIAPVIAVAAAAYLATRTFKKSGSGAKAVKVNFAALALVFAVCVFGSMAAFASGDDAAKTTKATTTTPAPAQEASTEEATAETTSDAAAAASGAATALGMGLIAAALSTSLSGIGGGIAVASAAPAAIGATSEDPKAFGKAIIFVALGESIALYGLVISIMILSKVPSITDLLSAL